jgi:CRP-like cAMP-binding protein
MARPNLILGRGVPPHTRGLERVHLVVGACLVRFGQVSRYAYFPLSGVISLVAVTGAGQAVEVSAIGRNGVAGASATVVGGLSPFELMVQVPGDAIQADRAALLSLLAPEHALGEMVQFAHLLIAEIAQSSVCNRYHRSDRRLARWLLTLSDRAETDTFPMTHETIALLTGTVRPRVTTAMDDLRRRGVLRYRRGHVTIVDRAALAGRCCECYSIVSQLFTRPTTKNVLNAPLHQMSAAQS